MTKKPCPGCGEVSHSRKSDKICFSCEKLMADGRRYRESIIEKKSAGKVFVCNRVSHWNPYWHDAGNVAGGSNREAQNAFWNLVYIVGKKLDGVEKNYDEIPQDIDALKRCDSSDLCSRSIAFFEMEPDVVEKLQALELAIIKWAHQAYRSGFENGSNMLKRMAADEISVGEFDSKLIENAKNNYIQKMLRV